MERSSEVIERDNVYLYEKEIRDIERLFKELGFFTICSKTKKYS